MATHSRDGAGPQASHTPDFHHTNLKIVCPQAARPTGGFVVYTKCMIRKRDLVLANEQLTRELVRRERLILELELENDDLRKVVYNSNKKLSI